MIPIINTRPSERAGSLTEALQQLGYPVRELPLLTLSPMPLDDNMKSQFHQFADIELVIAVSPTAVDVAMQYAQKLSVDVQAGVQKHWFAVGKATQKRLADYGIIGECPLIETSEGLLDLPQIAYAANQKVAFWRGIDGRMTVLQHLAQRGCTILNMALYRRQLPTYSMSDLQHHVASFPAAVLISSGESWQNWLQLNRQCAAWQDFLTRHIYMVLGERVTRSVQQDLPSARILTLTRLTAAEIGQQLTAIGL